ncbi:hypothetical protein C8J57DRAFT_1305278 [Mycena rebaudengoi]|nr:hypothetical protein C8J57DRAFT_1305278 [Mycena rebaudengoi]
MDPLKVSELHLTEDWDKFEAGTKGYIPPQPLALWPDCRDIEHQIREYTSTAYMRDNGAPFIALSVVQDFPTTRLTIRNEVFTPPLPSREMTFLAAHLGDAHASRLAMAGSEVNLHKTCSMFISDVVTYDVLRKLKATFGNWTRRETLVALDVFKAGSHELVTAPKDCNHVVSIFVILPSLVAANIEVHASYETVHSDVTLPQDITQSVSAIGMYTGVSDARIEVDVGGEVICLTYHICDEPNHERSTAPRLKYLSGALLSLRDAFCSWRHSVNSGSNTPALMIFFLDDEPKSARYFRSDDATLLCHLAPLAKAYGFKIYIAQLVHTISSEEEASHGYKDSEYFGIDEDQDIRQLSVPDVDYKWKTLRTLGGRPVTKAALLKLATRLVTTDGLLQDQLMDIVVRQDFKIVDDAFNSASVIYKHTRSASVLFIAPLEP